MISKTCKKIIKNKELTTAEKGSNVTSCREHRKWWVLKELNGD